MITVGKDIVVSLAIGAGVLVGVVLILSMMPSVPDSDSEPTMPAVSIVTIPENASLESSGGGFEPSPIEVVIGVNNTVRWVNQDSVMSSVVADESGDPDFVNATKIRCENDDYQNCTRIPGENFLLPGETFEHTFTAPGVFDYYSVPHPHMRGTVIVLEKPQ